MQNGASSKPATVATALLENPIKGTFADYSVSVQNMDDTPRRAQTVSEQF